ncbi:ABC transporter substrate-binding protein [Caldicoprobacter algeriensis]|uniref:ABC transporter substrate-binding protein n=1 Tax=Caldicoprobacter algeriensis TaxID=699281 RepID=UPI0020796E06|nr:ABC transporter substrate-binding protein [Caldicoprobacter algeriensis]MCM8901566.1 ABC transporter substrate-binding protein [Caldicoprobacter algeriensis]
MKEKFIRTIFAIILALLMLNLAGCKSTYETNTQTEIKTIKIAYIPLTHAVPLYIQNELLKQNPQDVKLELVKFSSWPEVIEALNAGKVDGASILIQLAMKAREQGIDLKAVALGHRDGNVVVTSKYITSVAELKGKTFAIPHRLSTHNILLYIMLKNNGLSYNDINVIELPPPEMPAALSEGRISGYSVAEPFGAVSVANGKGKVLFNSQDLWGNSVCCALVLRNDFIQNNRSIAEKFVQEYVKAAHKADSKDRATLDILTKYLRTDSRVLELSLKWISYKNLKLEEKDYNDLSKYLVEMGLIENPPPYSDFVDNTLIDNAK